MALGRGKINEPALGNEQNGFQPPLFLPLSKGEMKWGYFIFHEVWPDRNFFFRYLFQSLYVYFHVKMSGVGHNRSVFHAFKNMQINNIDIPGGCHKNIANRG